MTRRTATSCTRPPSPTASTRRASRSSLLASCSRRDRGPSTSCDIKETARVATPPTAWARCAASRRSPPIAAEPRRPARARRRPARRARAPAARARAGAAAAAEKVAALTEHAESRARRVGRRARARRCTRAQQRRVETTPAAAVTISCDGLDHVAPVALASELSTILLLSESSLASCASCAAGTPRLTCTAEASAAVPCCASTKTQSSIATARRIGFSSCTRRWRARWEPGPRRASVGRARRPRRTGAALSAGGHRRARVAARARREALRRNTQQCLAPIHLRSFAEPFSTFAMAGRRAASQGPRRSRRGRRNRRARPMTPKGTGSMQRQAVPRPTRATRRGALPCSPSTAVRAAGRADRQVQRKERSGGAARRARRSDEQSSSSPAGRRARGCLSQATRAARRGVRAPRRQRLTVRDRADPFGAARRGNPSARIFSGDSRTAPGRCCKRR